MNKNEATQNLQAATEARRAAQANIFSSQAEIAQALRVERNARYEVEKFERATAAEGFRFNR